MVEVFKEKEGQDNVEDSERTQGKITENVSGCDFPGHTKIVESTSLIVGHP